MISMVPRGYQTHHHKTQYTTEERVCPNDFYRTPPQHTDFLFYFQGIMIQINSNVVNRLPTDLLIFIFLITFTIISVLYTKCIRGEHIWHLFPLPTTFRNEATSQIIRYHMQCTYNRKTSRVAELVCGTGSGSGRTFRLS
jgi:hypothetical protein